MIQYDDMMILGRLTYACWIPSDVGV